MNGNNLVLDTNVILYLLDGDKTLANLLDGKQAYISFITELELLGYKGITKKEHANIKQFLLECKIININSSIKNDTILLKQKYSLKLPDCIIAGTAIFLDFPLISADNEFKEIIEIDLIFYKQ